MTAKCEGCESYIPASRDSQARYCSPACRTAAKSRRRYAARKADPVRKARMQERHAVNQANCYRRKKAEAICMTCRADVDLFHLDGTPYVRCTACNDKFGEIAKIRYREAGKIGKCKGCPNPIDMWHLDGRPYSRCSKCCEREDRYRERYKTDEVYAERRRETSRMSYRRRTALRSNNRDF